MARGNFAYIAYFVRTTLSDLGSGAGMSHKKGISDATGLNSFFVRTGRGAADLGQFVIRPGRTIPILPRGCSGFKRIGRRRIRIDGATPV